MKFLLDMPISPKIAKWLNESGHNAVHVRDLGLSQAPDTLILKWAMDDGRILITMDLDFPVILSITRSQKPSVILFRIRNATPDLMKNRLDCLFKTCKDGMAASMIVIEDDRIRVRKLPIR